MSDVDYPKNLGPLGDMAATEMIKALEARLAKLEARGHVTSDGSEDMEPENMDQLSNANTIFKVRRCDFEEFKNRFSADDGRYAVDVLMSGKLIHQEEHAELKIRKKLFEYTRDRDNSAKKKASKAEVAAKEANTAAVGQISDAQIEDSWLQRIRIQSPALLAILAKIQNETWSTRQRTYFRPFSTLLYFHPQMKKALKKLQEKWGPHEGSDTLATETDQVTTGGHELAHDCPAALAALRCYVDFFDEEVLPDYQRFDNLNWSSNTTTTIRFDDLDYLFKAGDDLYRPPDSNVIRSRDYKRIWRAYSIRIPGLVLKSAINNGHNKYRDPELQEGAELAFTVHALYLDFNGDEFITVTKSFTIMPYPGDIPITSLPIYPVRFEPEHQALLQAASEAGDRTLHFISTRHCTYNTWTVTRNPSGDAIIDPATGKTVQHAEHVNSEVMVDFAEAIQVCPAWKPVRSLVRLQAIVQEVVLDDFPIMVWSNRNRDKLLGELCDLIPLRTGVSAWKSNKYLQGDRLLRTIWDNFNRGQLTTAAHLHRQDGILLSGRVFAYVFTERKFAQLLAAKLRPSDGHGDVLESLRIPDNVKDIIQGSIKGHLIQKERGKGALSLDLIQGKGAGLFILLHGVPGVGKTATAEAIAQFHGKPLFKIACGDLGLTPSEVEGNLRGIFRLASLWDCILLLDEVDTFFSQRSKGDAAMNKNALVSVFLRVLDYYTGILFLTTNRAGALDEAFKSRIHYKIYYPPLNRQQTLEIWAGNIDRLHRLEQGQIGVEGERLAPMEIPERAEILRFAREMFDYIERERQRKVGAVHWSGRQIRNAFQVARSLAYSDAYTEAEAQRKAFGNESDTIVASRPILKIRHFQLMSEITAQFDAYMRDVFHGQNDSGLAREMENRNDDFESPVTDKPQRQPHSGFREPYQHPHPPPFDNYRDRADSGGFQGGLATTTWGGQSATFANAEPTPSPPVNQWGPVRSRQRAPTMGTSPSSAVMDTRLSSPWAARESVWQKSRVDNDEEPFAQPSPVAAPPLPFSRASTRPVDRYGGDELDAGQGQSPAVTGFVVPSFDRASRPDGANFPLPHSTRLGSGEYGNIASLR